MTNDWLGLAGKRVLVTGLRNKKSVAWHVGSALADAGATPIYTVRTRERQDQVAPLVGEHASLVCDVTDPASIAALATELAARGIELAGFVHSIAAANYEAKVDGTPRTFLETRREDFLKAVDVSCFSLIALSQALAPRLAPGSSIVALSISSTRLASESYGYMAPIKAALDSAAAFVAKSLAARDVRCNTVNPGLLKTSASAGIPGYVDNLLHAEQATLRHRGLDTREVADAVLFLLSPRSSGVNAQSLVVDAGMGVNWFDAEIVKRVARPSGP